tara:strand:- start:546 stop:1238 length:693 start_codon:yes stop_codon:yes gene_type:complete
MEPTNFINPSIEVLGILIQEPITTLTDFIVTIISLYAFYRIRKHPIKNRVVAFFKWYFLLMGIATFSGGIFGHAFLYYFNEYWKIPGWYISMIAIMLVERSAIIYAKNLISARLSRVFLFINAVELITIMVLSAYYLSFKFVEFHCVYGFLVVVFSFHLFIYMKTKNSASKVILWGVGVLATAMFVFNYPIVIDKWFNHKDFAHTIMAISSIIFLKGALLLEDPPIEFKD